MPSDKTLFIEFHTDFRNGENVYSRLAQKYGLSEDSVRGRISRADTLDNRISLAKTLSLHAAPTDRHVVRQRDLVNTHQMYFSPPFSGTGMFVTDIHLPHTRWDAVELTVVLASVIQPKIISGLSDLWEFSRYSKFGDQTSARSKVWSGDIHNALDAGMEFYRLFSRVAPNTRFPIIWGNHDLRYITWLREKLADAAEESIADFLDELDKIGLLVIALPYQQNWLKISPTLYWTHGSFGGKNPGTVSKSTLEVAEREDGGRNRPDVVSGHLHNSFQTKIGKAVHTSVAALASERMYYDKFNYGHGLGTAVSHWTPTNSRTELIDYVEEGRELAAYYNGMRYAVPLDKR